MRLTFPQFFEHFVVIAAAINGPDGLWDEGDGFFYDHVRSGGEHGERRPVKIRSFVGFIPLFACITIDEATIARLPGFAARMQWFLKHRRTLIAPYYHGPRVEGGPRLLSLVTREQLPRIMRRMLAEDEFLSPHGVRSLSKEHAQDRQPVSFTHGELSATLCYEPAESSSPIFGGNSNWRGPVWMPVNHLVVERLQLLDHYFGDSLMVELPSGSGRPATLWDVASDLSERLIGLFRRDPATGVRPASGREPGLARHARMERHIPFFEFFHGDTGAGLGARAQTGWTALVAKLIQQSGARAAAAAAQSKRDAEAPGGAGGGGAPHPSASRLGGTAGGARAAVRGGLGPLDSGTVLNLPAALAAAAAAVGTPAGALRRGAGPMQGSEQR